jgi:hypothetical protein
MPVDLNLYLKWEMRLWSKGESMQAIVQLFFIVTTKSEACWSIIVGQNPLFISTSLLCPTITPRAKIEFVKDKIIF